MSKNLLIDLTIEYHEWLVQMCKNREEVAENLHVSEYCLWSWEKKHGRSKRYSELQNERHVKRTQARIRTNNYFKEQGLKPKDFMKDLGFSTLNSYRSWKFRMLEKGFEVL